MDWPFTEGQTLAVVFVGYGLLVGFFMVKDIFKQREEE